MKPTRFSRVHSKQLEQRLRAKETGKNGFRHRTSKLADVVASVSRIFYPMGIIGGLWSLYSYCQFEGIPLPTTDSSFIVFVAIYAFFGALFLAFLSISLLTPAWVRVMAGESFKKALPGIFQPASDRQFGKLAVDYLVGYAALFASAAYVVGSVGSHQQFSWLYVAALFSVGLAISATLAAVRLGKAALWTVVGMWTANFMSLLWFLLMMASFERIGRALLQSVPKELAPTFLHLGSLLILALSHALLNCRRHDWKVDLYLFPAVAFLSVWLLDFGFASGVALNDLGLGGRIPVQLKLKEATKSESHCLLLMTGSVVIAAPTRTSEECQLQYGSTAKLGHVKVLSKDTVTELVIRPNSEALTADR